MSGGKRPVLKLRSGTLKAAVWENEHEDKKFHQVTLVNSYKDQDGQWHDTASLPTRILPAAAELLMEIFRTFEIKEEKAGGGGPEGPGAGSGGGPSPY